MKHAIGLYKKIFFSIVHCKKYNQICGLVEYVTNFVYFYNYQLKMTPSFIQSLVL